MTTTTKRGLKRFYEYRDRLRAVIRQLEKAPLEQRDPILIGKLRMALAHDEITIECAEQAKPMVSSWYGNALEILEAMDIHFFCPADNMMAHLNLTNLQDLEDSDKMSLPDDICSLIRLAYYAVEAGLVPTPTAVIAMMEPCDGEKALHESYRNAEEWSEIPYFAPDPPYGSTDEDFRYFAGELKRMIAFLEDLTGRKMDYAKLRAVIEETNRQYEIWTEYNELKRAIPCPAPSFEAADTFWPLTQHIRVGQPGTTEVMKMALDAAERRVKAGQGALENEKIRVFWLDLAPLWSDAIGSWLAEEWNANIVMDFQGYSPYTSIDTSTEETMLFGLARRCLSEVPMIRQARGNLDTLIEDMTRIIKDYRIDCVIFPGHMGHKDQSASSAFVRELCRGLNVPLLSLTTSLFDERYTPMDQVKKEISRFFTVTGLGT